MTSTAHIMSCTKKGCTLCDPKPNTKEPKKVQEEDDNYRLRNGYHRIGRK